MTPVFLALLLTFATATGGRAQLIVARFATAHDRTAPLLATGLAAALGSTLSMALAGSAAAGLLASQTLAWLVPVLLGVAAVRTVSPVRTRAMREPTRSFVAIGIVLYFRQLADAPRLLVFALVLASEESCAMLAGALIGSAGPVALGWLIGFERLEALPLRAARLTLGAGLALSAVSMMWPIWAG